MSADRQIAALKGYFRSELNALRRDLDHALRMIESLASAPLLPVREWTGVAANITITVNEVNMRHVVTNTAAIDFTLPAMDVRAIVEVMNDGASTDDVTVKNSGGVAIDTLTPGSPAVPYKLDSSGAVVPS